MSALVLTSQEALQAIADAPDSAEKTPADLREAADDFESQADRKDRLAVTRVNGNRRKARAKATQRKGDQLRLHAQVCRSAAEEIEKRKSLTVGEACKSAVVRAMRWAMRGKADGGVLVRDRGTTATFYCVKERKKVVAEATQGIGKSGRPCLHGVCPDCGAKCFKLGSLKSPESVRVER